VMSWEYGAHASTFGGNPVACAAALATIELLEAGLMENAAVVGEHLLAGLREVQTSVPHIGDVRGKGLMVGADFVEDRETRKPAPKLRNAVVMECFKNGLLVLGCGESSVRFCPALTVSRDQAHTALGIFAAACRETTRTWEYSHAG